MIEGSAIAIVEVHSPEVDEVEARDIAQKVERAMCAAGEEYLQTVPVKVETQIACQWAK